MLARRTGTIHPKEMATREKPIFPHHTLQAFGPIFVTVSPVRLVRFSTVVTANVPPGFLRVKQRK